MHPTFFLGRISKVWSVGWSNIHPEGSCSALDTYPKSSHFIFWTIAGEWYHSRVRKLRIRKVTRMPPAFPWVHLQTCPSPFLHLSLLFFMSLCLTKDFDLQIMEDYADGGCKNGYVRHVDSNILDHDGAQTPGTSQNHSLEDELLGLLGTSFSKKATPLLESR